MNKKNNKSVSLREAAEAELARTPPNNAHIKSAENLLHELEVHQIQLEMQNEALRHAHIELEESRDHYIEFYDFAPVGYFTLSREGLIKEINLTGAAMLSVDRNKLLQHRFTPLVIPEDQDRWHRYFMAVLQHDDKHTIDLCIQCGNGSRLNVKLDSVRFTKDGIAPVVRHVMTDINERKKQEIALASAKSIIDSSDDAIISKSLSGIIESWNKGAERIFGFTAKEAIGQSIQILIPPDLQNEESDILARVSCGEYVDQYETVRRHKNGRLIDISTTISPILNDEGRVVGASKIARDISERKRQASLLSFRLELIAMAAHADHLHLMQATLDKAEKLTSSTIGFFHYVEADQEAITLQTWSTNTLENMCKAEGAGQHYPVSEAGVWADAIRTKMAVIQNDYPHLKNKKGMPDGHAPVQRFISIPIIRNNKIVAMIGVVGAGV